MNTIHDWLSRSINENNNKFTYRILEFLNHENMYMTHEALQKTKIGKTVNKLIQAMTLQIKPKQQNENENKSNMNTRQKNANVTPELILETASSLFETWKKIVAIHKRTELSGAVFLTLLFFIFYLQGEDCARIVTVFNFFRFSLLLCFFVTMIKSCSWWWKN